MIPIDAIDSDGVRDLATEARHFRGRFAWCAEVRSGYLAWAVAGILGVFLFEIRPGRPGVDDQLWVVVGDLPPAYLVCTDAATWQQALSGYVLELQRWIDAVRVDGDVTGLMPVNAPPTPESADRLQPRIDFISKTLLPSNPGTLPSES